VPFTASHVAAVLPLARAPLVASALVIGSMIPDLPYYLPVALSAEMTHSLPGVVSADLLLGLGAFLLWHGLLSRPLLASAPKAVRGRLPAQDLATLRARLSPPRRLLLVILSLSVGAVTHVFWDAFTHAGRWGTVHVPWLAAQQGVLPGYRWAQYASGLLGALVVLLWLVGWWRRTDAVTPVAGVRPAVALLAWVAALVGGTVGAVIGSIDPLTAPDGPDLPGAGFGAVTRGIAAATLVAFMLAASWHLLRRRQQAGSRSSARL